ncbi:MAG TPA: class I SAM-dependent methyltransferase [Holophagaceae bacterium]|jgi:SAM-dependent methyltransferase|nr:class I SAM-dependent methyltransferase [Holophagaceae bacterium]
MDYLKYILGKIFRNPAQAARSGLKVVSEFLMDRRIGVSTFRRDFAAHASASGDSRPCQPVPYGTLAAVARHIQDHGFPLDAFVDVGCGTGRPLAYLSRLGFKRMVGIEINPDVADQARQNLRRIKPTWKRAESLEVLTEDVLAADFDFTGTIVYLANPFGKTTMLAFARRLKAQLLARPGSEILVYYALPLSDGALMETFPGAEPEPLKSIEPCHFFRLGGASISG